MAPYGTSAGVGRDAVGTPKVFRIFDLWKKKVIFLYQKIKKSSELVKYKGILTFWPLEKNPHEISVILVQKSLKTDNSESSYDTFWF